MRVLACDTQPKMEALQIEIIRRMPLWKKISIADGWNETVKTLAMIGLHSGFPQARGTEPQCRLADLLWGEELAQKVYGDSRYAK